MAPPLLSNLHPPTLNCESLLSTHRWRVVTPAKNMMESKTVIRGGIVVDWFGWLGGWLVGWLVGWLAGWLVGLVVDWLVMLLLVYCWFEFSLF